MLVFCNCAHLVGLDRRDFLVLLNKVANSLVPLLQCAFADRLGHCWHLDDLVGVGPDMLKLHRELSQHRVGEMERESRSGAGRKAKSSIQHLGVG